MAKANKVGFDWPDVGGALDKLKEETAELETSIQSGTGIEEELGDLLFSVVNIARILGFDPEDALHASTEKFIRRFSRLEAGAKKQGQALEDLSLDQMEALYQEGKNRL